MYKKLVELTVEQHENLTYHPVKNYEFARNMVSVPVTAGELGRVAKYYPVIFPDGDPVAPHAILGLEQGKNSYVSREGKWMMPYIPMSILCYPFALVRKNGELKLCIDKEAPHFAVEGEEGTRLFENGKYSGFTQQVVKFLEWFNNDLRATITAVRDLAKKGVLEENNLNVKVKNKVFSVAGCRVVNRERLRALEDSVLAEWVRSGLSMIIELHLMSLENLKTLALQHISIYGGLS
ncbi:MAG: SapC family protein [Deltaproteobacteria bacterium]|nr:SapC family protein [Deltaproteobacteria bacterium]MBW2069284.1 SapC family protein [Deltaproteobacteria bacterium]